VQQNAVRNTCVNGTVMDYSSAAKQLFQLQRRHRQRNRSSASFTASIQLTTLTVTAVSSGTIAVGQTLTGSGGINNTNIVAF